MNPNLSQITDDSFLLHRSSDPRYENENPGVSETRYIQSLATDGRPNHDAGLKQRARSIVSGANMRKDSLKLRSLSILNSQPLALLQQESFESLGRVLKPEHKFEEEIPYLGDNAMPTTLSSSKGRSDLAIAMTLIVFCLPFFFVFCYVIHLNHKPIDEDHWTRIQEILKLVSTI